MFQQYKPCRIALGGFHGNGLALQQGHQGGPVPGVREDVTDIVLNLKGVTLKMDVDAPKRLTLSAKGPGVDSLVADVHALAG